METQDVFSQKVSIAMATYNGEKYIEEQLQSLINQTYSPIEIIIVDDGSTDNTVEIVKGYQYTYPFILLHINEKNSGVSKTFEKAISLCTGTFIALCDQDDIWELHKIKTLVNAIGEFDAVYSNSLLVDATGKSLGKEFTSIMNMQTYTSGTPFLLSNSVPGHTILMKRDFVLGILPFPDNMLFDLWIGFNAGGNNGIKYVNETLVKYRQHETNTIGTRDSKNKKKKLTPQQEFEAKKFELETLATAPIGDTKTKAILQTMLSVYHRNFSIKRSIFFFTNFNDLLISKQKPTYRKVLYCFKMLFKPNF